MSQKTLNIDTLIGLVDAGIKATLGVHMDPQVFRDVADVVEYLKFLKEQANAGHDNGHDHPEQRSVDIADVVTDE